MPFERKENSENIKPTVELFPDSQVIMTEIKEKFRLNGMKNISRTFIINKLINKYGRQYAESITDKTY